MLQESFPEANRILTKADYLTEEQAPKVPACITKRHGKQVIITKWKANYEDIQRFNETGELWLSVNLYENGEIPHAEVFTENPFEDL